MLSRIAESLYWIGRYTERAGSAARILDVYAHSLLEDRLGEEEAACVHLLEALGAGDAAADIGADVEELIAFVIDDPRFGGSIVGSLDAAWENARGVREAISSEMWESINTTRAALSGRRAASAFARHGLLVWVRDRAAIVSALADTTMSHDDAWQFLVLGRTLERVDMTVRLVSTRLGDAWGSEGWAAMLRCCSAYEAYLRTYRRGVDGSRALEFLLLDRLFPSSVFHTLTLAESVLVDLDPHAGRRGMGGESRRIVGSACASLEFVRAAELQLALHDHLDRLERAIVDAHEAIANEYFHAAARDPVERVMAWRLAIEHVTEYEYAGEVLASYNETRITPRPARGQVVLDHRVDVDPAAPSIGYIDYWGSEVCAFDVHRPHRRLVVTGRSLVETPDARVVVDPVDWDELRSPAVLDRFHEYLAPSRYVSLDSPMREFAAALARNRSPFETVVAVTEWTRARLAYEPGATNVSTTAAEALDLGRGVCQDFVHVSIALLRASGIPARYASGYLHPNDDAQTGETVVGQSHAWLEAWVGEWQGVDPTNGADVGPQHVLVARGRDYGDVVPLKGVFHGPPNASVAVRVAITRVA